MCFAAVDDISTDIAASRGPSAIAAGPLNEQVWGTDGIENKRMLSSPRSDFFTPAVPVTVTVQWYFCRDLSFLGNRYK